MWAGAPESTPVGEQQKTPRWEDLQRRRPCSAGPREASGCLQPGLGGIPSADGGAPAAGPPTCGCAPTSRRPPPLLAPLVSPPPCPAPLKRPFRMLVEDPTPEDAGISFLETRSNPPPVKTWGSAPWRLAPPPPPLKMGGLVPEDSLYPPTPEDTRSGPLRPPSILPPELESSWLHNKDSDWLDSLAIVFSQINGE